MLSCTGKMAIGKLLHIGKQRLVAASLLRHCRRAAYHSHRVYAARCRMQDDVMARWEVNAASV